MKHETVIKVPTKTQSMEWLSAHLAQYEPPCATGMAKFEQRRIAYREEKTKSEHRQGQYDRISAEITQFGQRQVEITVLAGLHTVSQPGYVTPEFIRLYSASSYK